MSVPNFRKSYHMGFEKNCRKSRLSKQFDKTGNSGKSIQPKIGTIENVTGICIHCLSKTVQALYTCLDREGET